ncbi:hypothetical protein C0992_002405, partial [Termitomyces sp. T32_za158]
MANVAWKEVDTTTIRNCWKKSGILLDTLLNPASDSSATPFIPVSSLLSSEAEVTNALSHLEKIGVLQANNQMDINELLNPANEDNMYDNGTDESQAVDNGGDAEAIGSNTHKPSCQEALTTASTILDYISDMDDPFVRKLETVLASFGRQTHLDGLQDLRPTTINQYFTLHN